MDARGTLERIQRDLHARERELEDELATLRDERDQAIRVAHDPGGMTTREIAEIVGLSHQRVAQIILRR